MVACRGQKFYQTSNTITADATVLGGAGTEIIFKAGTEVVLNPGFTITEQNMLKVVNGPCDAGGVPVINTLQQPKPVLPAFVNVAVPKGETTQYPYGFLNIGSNANGMVNIQIHKMELGQFNIRMVDNTGAEITIPNLQLVAAKGIENMQLKLPQVAAGTYYLQLYYNGGLIHYQEVHVP